MDLPIYCREVDNFRWWEDAYGNKLEISSLDSEYLNDMIHFLKRVLRDDTTCNINTCNGFIRSMTVELKNRNK